MSDVDSKIAKLEARVAELEAAATKTRKVPKKPREPSEYNKFMKTKYNELKEAHPEMKHQERFAECAKAWQQLKST